MTSSVTKEDVKLKVTCERPVLDPESEEPSVRGAIGEKANWPKVNKMYKVNKICTRYIRN